MNNTNTTAAAADSPKPLRVVRLAPQFGLCTLFRPLAKSKSGRPTLDMTYQYGRLSLRFSAKEALGVPEQTLLLVLLELAAEHLPRGWVRSDWSAVAANLQDPADRSIPALCFRVAEPESGLAVTVTSATFPSGPSRWQTCCTVKPSSFLAHT